ncbi:AMP-binding protein [Aquincola sp. S2]|uniref:AMP-binding protein n=1 Tax=Pseudaquabacterium terrae TaxID=2732868 RepID=A0ABX2EUM0_9BURK|nr:AMP-binding protein [Aquabacterium terrae]NRF72373.1 AMP-binding protein [Aquabacterium terrae]
MLPIDHLYRTARLLPDSVAVESDSTALSYRELALRVDALAAHVQSIVPGCRNRIAICGHNSLAHYLAILATYACGNTWVALNPQNSKRDLDRIVEVTRPALFIVDDDCLDKFTPNGAPVLIATDVSGGTGFESIIRRHGGDRPNRDGVTLDDLQAIKFTGGSSGVPKAVQQPYRVGSTVHLHMRLMYGYHGGDTGLAVSPLTHAGGTYILPLLAVGGRTILLRKPAAPAILDAIEQRGVTRMFLAPTLLYALMAEQQRQPRDTRALHSITYGAAPMPVEKIRQAQAIFGAKIDVTYGQTEASQCLTGATREQLADERHAGTVGRPGPLVQVEVMDAQGRILPPGESGEVVARGDLLMKGYLDNPELTAATIVDGWLHTGDLGAFDEQGFLTIRGRLKEMIISGGFNVYPTDVEAALSKHPGVHESIVFGLSDEKWGERVEAAVRLRDGASVDAAELIRFVKAEIGSVQAPKAIHIVADLPRNEVGKVVRREVRQRFEQDEPGAASKVQP